jgi:opacity protein-like surface antigen
MQEAIMKKKIFALAALFLAGAVLPAAANTVTVRFSFTMPTMKSDFWTTDFANMNYKRTNFQDTSFGIDFEIFLTRELSLLFSFDTFTKSKAGIYKNYVGYQLDGGDFAFPATFQGDYAPGHNLRYTVTPIQASIKIAPLGRRVKVIPYIGGGVGLYIYSLRMSGDLIDFSDPFVYTEPGYPDVDIFPIRSVDAREGENFGRIAFGYQVFGGVQVPIGSRLTLEGEVKYSSAKSKMNNFIGFQPLDLGSLQMSLGIAYWF